jgi:hypothetical protein
MGFLRRLWKHLLLLISTLAFGVGSCEFLYRFLLRLQYRKGNADFDSIVFRLEPDSELVFSLLAGLNRIHGTYNSPEAPRWSIRTNSEGF